MQLDSGLPAECETPSTLYRPLPTPSPRRVSTLEMIGAPGKILNYIVLLLILVQQLPLPTLLSVPLPPCPLMLLRSPDVSM